MDISSFDENHRKIERETERWRDRETERQRDRETEREREKERESANPRGKEQDSVCERKENLSQNCHTGILPTRTKNAAMGVKESQ